MEKIESLLNQVLANQVVIFKKLTIIENKVKSKNVTSPSLESSKTELSREAALVKTYS